MEFRKELRKTKVLDPRNAFQETWLTGEVRYDPITEEMARVYSYRKVQLKRHDWAPVVAASQNLSCPFCPDMLEKSTPLFPKDLIPDGRFRFGRAVVVPNISPYAPYSGVTIMSPEHYIPLNNFNLQTIIEGLSAAVFFLREIRQHEPDNSLYPSISWNYMPYAGGSIIHPHIHTFAGPEPTNRQLLLLEKSQAYRKATGRNCWADLVDSERKAGERYLGKNGPLHLISSFAPRSLADFSLVFENKSTLEDLESGDFEIFAATLQKIFNYYDSLNLPSFNLALFPAPQPMEGYWLNARITGRFTIFGWTSDINTMQMLFGDYYSLVSPEQITQEFAAMYS